MKRFAILIIILTFVSLVRGQASVKWTAKSELTTINDADILVVVDDPSGTPLSKKITVLNFFDTIDTSAKLAAIVGDETGTGVLMYATNPTITTNINMPQLTFASVTVPNADGEISFDTDGDGATVTTGVINGHDGTAAIYFFPVDAYPGADNFIMKYDAGTNKLVWEADADSGGSTLWSAIGDPTNNGLTTITFDNAELSLLTGDNDAAASFFTIQNTDADHTGGNLYLLDLDYSADDGDVDADYIRLQDSGGVVMTIQQDGEIATDGGVTAVGNVGAADLTASDDIIGQDDLQLDSDAALIQLGEDQDVVLTHVADTGVLLTGGTDEQLQIGDAGTYINQGTDGTLNLVGDTLIESTAPNIRLMFDAAAYLNVATADGGVTTISQVSDGADGIVIGDGGDTVAIASAGLDLDTSGNITNAGTIGSGAITSTGAVGGTDLTASDDIIGQDDLQLDSDAALVQLGEDQDVTITHVADTGFLVTGTTDNQIQIGDAGTFLNQSTDGTLNMEGDTLVEITAPNIRLEFDDAAYLNVATADGGVTTISQVSDGTDEIILGDGGDLVSVASGNWDVSNAGVFSGMTGITSTGAMDFGGATSIEIVNATDPDVDAAGEISQDTDGANETGDVSIRAYDGSNQFLVDRKLKTIQATVMKPNDLADAQRDQTPIWHNNTGMVFTIVEIWAWSDVDDTSVNLEVVTATDWSTPGTIDALEIATDGTSIFYVTETTITDPTIAHDEIIVADHDDTDDPGFVKYNIIGWFNSDID